MKPLLDIQPVERLDSKTLRLVKLAAKVRKRAYAPYSKYLVGTCIVDEKGRLHSGCNFENASYGAGICSERNAVGKMISRGGRRIRKIVLVSSSEEPAFPCGLCLQVLNEFGPDAEVVAVNKRLSKFANKKLGDLYPFAYSRSELES